MIISVFGLGYVGVVSAACLTDDGHTVIGVDPNQDKVDLINNGKSPIIEEHIGGLIAAGVESGLLSATIDSAAAVRASDLAFICVGTPSRPNGSLELDYVERVSSQIGAALKDRDGFFVVVLRSTVLPGTTRGLVVPALEAASGKRAGEDFGVCFNPEFLREGTAVHDYRNPPKTVVGATDERSRKILNEINAKLEAPLIEPELEIAEMVKYADNSWHAVKIGFANEIGTLAKTLGLDGKEVMKIFCQDTKLNLSDKYLRPGFAFGGSCLPKDLRALNHKGRSLDLDLPLLSSVLPSNERHIERAFRMVTDLGKRPVGVLGLSFKAGTDDLRESPAVELVEHLIGKGFDIRIFDGHVNLAKLVGANRDYILNHIPHISNLMVGSVGEAIDHGEIIVIGNGDPAFREAADNAGAGRIVVDLAGVSEKTSDGNLYHGICW